MKRGIILALFSYLFWGILPIYWKLLEHVPSIEILAHRIFWAFIFFAVVLFFSKEWKGLTAKIKSSQPKWLLFVPALLIGTNWGVYIWAVNHGFIVETSLGYFISPLISVFLGVIFLKEKLRPVQWAAVAIAAAGVLVMTFIYGFFPWVSLYLAGTWGTYGLLRKKSPLNSVEGLTLETACLLLPVCVYLFYLAMTGNGFFLSDVITTTKLIGAGVVTGIPLLTFIKGARLIDLSLMGVLQYIYPTLIFLTGVFIYNEPLTDAKIAGFIIIWIALIIYSVEGIIRNRNFHNSFR